MKNALQFFLLLIIFLLISSSLFSINYTIDFTGSGLSSKIDSVIVQNLSKGTSVTIYEGNVLNLTDLTTGVLSVDKFETYQIITNKSLSFYSKCSGNTFLSVYTVDGKKIFSSCDNLNKGLNTYYYSLPMGVYFLKIEGDNYTYKIKIISQSNVFTKLAFDFNSHRIGYSNKPFKNKNSETTMLYSVGDQLLFKGFSGVYNTIVTDKPLESKTIDFEFFECKDESGNNYSTVRIGTQVWMAENLAYLPFVSGGVGVYSYSLPHYYVLGNESKDLTVAMNNPNYKKYGALYNWTAASTASPKGWHLPSEEEVFELKNFLVINSYSIGDSVNYIAKSLSSTVGWTANESFGTPGCEPSLNNATGFSALQCGVHYNSYYSVNGWNSWWIKSVINIPEERAKGYFGGFSDMQIDTTIAKSMGIYSAFSELYINYDIKATGNSVRCIKNQKPAISTSEITAIDFSSFNCGGVINYDGGAVVSKRGVCWSTNSNPTIDLSTKTIDGNGTGNFSSVVSGLLPNITYYVRAYATNSEGTAYGNEIIFKTSSLKIGDFYQGGKIAYIFQYGENGYVEGEVHGLIVALNDQSIGARWGNDSSTGATARSIGWGMSNSLKIIYNNGDGSYAAKICADLVVDNYSDWYLPSIDELSKLNNINLTSGQGYWSSTEISNTYAACKFFGNTGGPATNIKATAYRVRAIRSF